MSAFKYFMKTEHPQVVSCMWYAQPAVASVKDHCQSAALAWRKHEEWRRLKLMHAWQLRTMTDKSRLLTDSDKSRTELSLLQVSPCIIDTHKRKKFSS